MSVVNGPPRLTEEEKRSLLCLARASLERGVISGGGLSPEEEEHFANGAASRETGNCFVSLHLMKSLRGCIGTLSGASPLYRAVALSALNAGLRDMRFPPLTVEELSRCVIEISALSPLALIRSAGDIVVGRHGLVAQRGENRGLLLPQVATQQGWDAVEFLRQTYRKAGLEARSEPARGDQLYVFEACVFGEEDFGPASGRQG